VARGPLAAVAKALIHIRQTLEKLGVDYALVGGLAVSARAEPRTTRDVDLAVAVADDATAERLLFGLQGSGYLVGTLVEQTKTHRLATARLQREGGAVIVDLLFASSGIEAEITSRATKLELIPGVELPVASVGDLLAVKILARDDRTRPQDWDDIRALLAVATWGDRAQAEASLRLIRERGFGRGRPLLVLWKKALAEFT
jgi:predicted nucleotidyltransferase